MVPNKTINSPETESQLAPVVRAGVNLIALAVRNYTLYPESNSIRLQSMDNLHRWLTGYLAANENLRLTVEKDWFVFNGEIVYQDKPDEQPLAAPLFRDGIQWFEFQENLSLEELITFISLICRFKTLKEEAEDDLATCLWEANLPHIKHKTADDFWEIDPMMEINSLSGLIEASDDPNSPNIAAHIQAGSKTVGLVLEALNKVDNKKEDSFGGGLSGLAAGEGSAGQMAALMTGGAEAGRNREGAGEGEGPSSAQGGSGQYRHLDHLPESEGGQEITELFAELLAGLESAVSPKQRQILSGAMTTDGTIKSRPSGQQPVYVDLSDFEKGSQTKRGNQLFEGDEENGTPTDAAMAEALFKVSTYFDTQGESPFWKLTQTEQYHLQSLVAVEEKRSTISDCLAILRIMLHSLSSQDERLEVIDFIAEEARYALATGDLSFFRTFLEQMNQEARAIGQKVQDPANWLGHFLIELNKKLATYEVLGALAEPLDTVALTDEYFRELKSFLLFLPADTIFVLLTIIPKIQDQRLAAALLEVSAVESGQVVQGDLTALVGALKPPLILDFINLIRDRALPLPLELMFGLTRNEVAQIRQEAVRLLLERQPESIKRLVHLVADQHLPISQMICAQMSQSRNFQAERTILDHLGEIQARGSDYSRGHVFNCYRAFGLSASAHTIGYLEDILLRKNWMSFLGLEENWHRVGAALALMLMPQEWGVKAILKEASQSRFRNIRLAYEEAARELPLGWKERDDD